MVIAAESTVYVAPVLNRRPLSPPRQQPLQLGSLDLQLGVAVGDLVEDLLERERKMKEREGQFVKHDESLLGYMMLTSAQLDGVVESACRRGKYNSMSYGSCCSATHIAVVLLGCPFLDEHHLPLVKVTQQGQLLCDMSDVRGKHVREARLSEVQAGGRGKVQLLATCWITGSILTRKELSQ
jgi:hypothetical protein